MPAEGDKSSQICDPHLTPSLGCARDRARASRPEGEGGSRDGRKVRFGPRSEYHCPLRLRAIALALRVNPPPRWWRVYITPRRFLRLLRLMRKEGRYEN